MNRNLIQQRVCKDNDSTQLPIAQAIRPDAEEANSKELLRIALKGPGRKNRFRKSSIHGDKPTSIQSSEPVNRPSRSRSIVGPATLPFADAPSEGGSTASVMLENEITDDTRIEGDQLELEQMMRQLLKHTEECTFIVGVKWVIPTEDNFFLVFEAIPGHPHRGGVFLSSLFARISSSALLVSSHLSPRLSIAPSTTSAATTSLSFPIPESVIKLWTAEIVTALTFLHDLDFVYGYWCTQPGGELSIVLTMLETVTLFQRVSSSTHKVL